MPSSIVMSFSKRSGKSADEVERLWSKAKNIATSAGKTGDDHYAYVVGILKRMLKLEHLSDGDIMGLVENFSIKFVLSENSVLVSSGGKEKSLSYPQFTVMMRVTRLSSRNDFVEYLQKHKTAEIDLPLYHKRVVEAYLRG